MTKTLYYAGIALISAATILLELTLLRLFAVQQFYHFAFMAISLALLGAGASGSILSVWRRRLSPAALCLAFALVTLGAYLVVNYLPFDSFSIAWDRRQVAYLALYFLAAAAPFLFSGLLVGGELSAVGDQSRDGGPGSHQVYGANLIGSAAGSLFSLVVLAAAGGERAVLVAMLLAAISGLLFSRAEWRSGNGVTPRAGLTLILAGLAIVSLAALARPPAFLAQRLSPYKTLSVLSQTLNAQHTLTAWDAGARVDVVESSAIHVMPGLSLLAPVSIPLQAGLMLDGDSLMPITRLSSRALDADSEQARLLADYLPSGLAFRLRPGARCLVLEAGTGMDVLFALAAGAKQVTAVEENKLVIDVVKNTYGAFTAGLYSDPRVEVVNQSGRVFARRLEQPAYDLVILALNDPYRPVSSGAYSLTEDYSYTVDAFDDYLKALNQDGLLVVTRWLQTPPSESARTFGAVAAALDQRGLDPADHLVAFRTMRTMTILAGLHPFSGEDIAAIREFLTRRNFDAVYFPGIGPDELNRFNILQEEAYHELFSRILADPQAVYADYRFDIRPPIDERPFFFHYFKWRQTPEILATLGLSWQPFGGSGYFVLIALLLLVGVASAVLIIGPLLFRRQDGNDRPPHEVPRWRLRVFVYFACLGLAFLFVEVPLAQRFILVLDQPVTALAVVLFAVLFFSGLGSLTVRRWSLSWGLGALVGLIVLMPFLLPPLTDVALSLPEWGRIGLTALVLAPLGYLMGLPFAGGLQVLELRQPSLIPWAWAINGSFSVISSVLAVIIALSWGFPAVLWLGAAAYALALLSFGRLGPAKEPARQL